MLASSHHAENSLYFHPKLHIHHINPSSYARRVSLTPYTRLSACVRESMPASLHPCTHACLQSRIHTCIRTLTLPVIISSSLPPTSHRYLTTSRYPPSMAIMRQVQPSCKRWPSDHQPAPPQTHPPRPLHCCSAYSHPRRGPQLPCGLHVNHVQAVFIGCNMLGALSRHGLKSSSTLNSMLLL